MERRKSTGLLSLLIRFIFLCVLVMCLLILVWWGLMNILMLKDVILSANAAEKQAEQAAEKMEASKSFDRDVIPELCDYVLLDEEGSVIETSMTGRALQTALRYHEGKNGMSNRFHISVRLDPGICILQYRFRMEYADEGLRKKLPNFDTTYSLFFAALFLLSEGTVVTHYTRRFRRSLIPLKRAAGELAAGNLENEFQRVGIKEYDDVLGAVGKLQTALKLSLQEQWKETHARAEQTAALAHDIRTPLTVISGNAQLLAEEPEMLSEEQRACVEAIVRNADAAQAYVERLREMTRAERAEIQRDAQKDTWIGGEAFYREIVRDAEELCGVFGRKLIPSGNVQGRGVRVNMQEIKRGISNIVRNAAEHTPFEEAVKLSFDWEEKQLRITVEDGGGGFSAKALRHALEPLFTENKSRTGESHMGLGLAIANTVAAGYGGCLEISNTEEGHGRVVFTIGLPVENVAPSEDGQSAVLHGSEKAGAVFLKGEQQDQSKDTAGNDLSGRDGNE